MGMLAREGWAIFLKSCLTCKSWACVLGYEVQGEALAPEAPRLLAPLPSNLPGRSSADGPASCSVLLLLHLEILAFQPP